MFDFDIVENSGMLMPPVLRTGTVKAWLKCALAPLVWLYAAFRAYRSFSLAFLRLPYSQKELEYLLNYYFNTVARPIVINTIIPYRPVVSGRVEGGNFPVFDKTGTNKAIRGRALYETDYDFIVNLPVEMQLTIDEAKLREYINRYKPAGKRYNIEYYIYQPDNDNVDE